MKIMMQQLKAPLSLVHQMLAHFKLSNSLAMLKPSWEKSFYFEPMYRFLRACICLKITWFCVNLQNTYYDWWLGFGGLFANTFIPPKCSVKLWEKNKIDTVSKNKEKTTTMTAFRWAYRTIISFSHPKENKLWNVFQFQMPILLR